jgi:nucleotide-binding universal stress UspA family protein
MFGTILLAADGSAHADRATELARTISTAGGDEVVVVQVTEILAGRYSGTVEIDEDQAAITRTKRHAEELEAAGVKTQVEQHRAIAGHVAKIIVEAGQQHDAGLIVMGSRGRTDRLPWCSAVSRTRFSTSVTDRC